MPLMNPSAVAEPKTIVADAAGTVSTSEGAVGETAAAESATVEPEVKAKRARRDDYPQHSAEDIIKAVVAIIGAGKLIKDPQGGPDVLPYEVLREELGWPDDGEARAVLRQRYNNYRNGRGNMEAIKLLPPLDRKAHTGGINARTDTAALTQMLAAALGQAD